MDTVHVALGKPTEITLREWYAGIALHALLSNPSFDVVTYEMYVHDAALIADALVRHIGKETHNV